MNVRAANAYGVAVGAAPAAGARVAAGAVVAVGAAVGAGLGVAVAAAPHATAITSKKAARMGRRVRILSNWRLDIAIPPYVVGLHVVGPLAAANLPGKGLPGFRSSIATLFPGYGKTIHQSQIVSGPDDFNPIWRNGESLAYYSCKVKLLGAGFKDWRSLGRSLADFDTNRP